MAIQIAYSAYADDDADRREYILSLAYNDKADNYVWIKMKSFLLDIKPQIQMTDTTTPYHSDSHGTQISKYNSIV